MRNRTGAMVVVLGLLLGAAGGTAIRRVGPTADLRSNVTDPGVVVPGEPTDAPMPPEVLDLAQEYEDRFNAGDREELDELVCPEMLPREQFGTYPRTPIYLPDPGVTSDERVAVRAIDMDVSRFQAGEDGQAWVDYYIDVELAEPEGGRQVFTGGTLRLRSVDERWLICDDRN